MKHQSKAEQALNKKLKELDSRIDEVLNLSEGRTARDTAQAGKARGQNIRGQLLFRRAALGVGNGLFDARHDGRRQLQDQS